MTEKVCETLGCLQPAVAKVSIPYRGDEVKVSLLCQIHLDRMMETARSRGVTVQDNRKVNHE